MPTPSMNCAPPATYAEIFFVQRAMELLNAHSIDSYRLPLHNPKTLIKEIASVIQSLHSDELPRDEYAWVLVEEAVAIFNQKHHISFKSINEEYFKKVLRDKNVGLKRVFYACAILLNDNKRYGFVLAEKIKKEITDINALTNPTPENLNTLNDLTSYFLIELREMGYSKPYLYKFVKSIFYFITDVLPFNGKLAIILSLLNRPKENFEIVVGLQLKTNVSNQLQMLDPSIQRVDSGGIMAIISRTNERVRSYFSAHPETSFFRIEAKCYDYYSASIQVRKNLKITLDSLFMGYSGDNFEFNPRCVVIGSRNPNMAGVHFLHYQLEGYYTSSQRMYKVFSDRIKSIKDKGVLLDSLNRIEGALRYFRLGSGVDELDSKLMNYWIGMEYFFSTSDSKSSKTKRMRDFFKVLHGRIYYKRLLNDFHQKIRSHQISSLVTNYQENLKYLLDIRNLEIISQNRSSPLIAYRAYRLKEKVFNSKALTEDIKRHAKRLEWNLLRIYRQRNSIVHSANSDTNILDITSHLKYYLIFAINSAVDYLNISKLDINMDGKLTLDDYFLSSETEYENLISDKDLNIEKILKIRNPLEFLS
jgi:hypothetical protein